MADIAVLSGAAGQDPVDLTTGPQAAPSRLFGVTPKTQPAALAFGAQHLVLPEWTTVKGASTFMIGTSTGGAQLTGMAGLVGDIIEYPLVGMIMALINIGADLLTTSANDSGSPDGTRFSAAVNMQVNTATQFICGMIGGVTMWFPISYQAVG